MEWCGVVWCGVVWRGVVWCGVVWSGVVWWVVWSGVEWSNRVASNTGLPRKKEVKLLVGAGKAWFEAKSRARYMLCHCVCACECMCVRSAVMYHSCCSHGTAAPAVSWWTACWTHSVCNNKRNRVSTQRDSCGLLTQLFMLSNRWCNKSPLGDKQDRFVIKNNTLTC